MWQNVKQYTAKVHQTSPPRIFSGLHRPPFATFTGAPAPAGHRGVGGAHDYKHQRHLGRCQRTLHVVIARVPASLAQRQRRGTAADGGETQSGQDEDGTGVVSCYQTWVSRLCDEFFLLKYVAIEVDEFGDVFLSVAFRNCEPARWFF